MSKAPAVAVIGAGPAGAMAALQLARAGLSVQIIGKQKRPRRYVGETLSPEGRSALTVAGIWDRLPDGIAVPCPALVSAWQESQPVWRSFITNPYGSAWHIDRAQFDAWLLGEAEAAGAVCVSAAAIAVRRIGSHWVCDVRGADGEARALRADFLILATGTYSSALQLAKREQIDALCLIAGVSKATPTAGDALVVEAGPAGWLYSAPLPDGRIFVGWITDADVLAGKQYRVAMESALEYAPLTSARVERSPDASCVGVASSAMVPCAGEGWIAIGDAALARDPLSGEGLACALHSAREAADTISYALAGDTTTWQKGAERAAKAVAQYQHQRLFAYRAAQSRWPSEDFWARRVAN